MYPGLKAFMVQSGISLVSEETCGPGVGNVVIREKDCTGVCGPSASSASVISQQEVACVERLA